MSQRACRLGGPQTDCTLHCRAFHSWERPSAPRARRQAPPSAHWTVEDSSRSGLFPRSLSAGSAILGFTGGACHPSHRPFAVDGRQGRRQWHDRASDGNEQNPGTLRVTARGTHWGEWSPARRRGGAGFGGSLTNLKSLHRRHASHSTPPVGSQIPVAASFLPHLTACQVHSQWFDSAAVQRGDIPLSLSALTAYPRKAAQGYKLRAKMPPFPHSPSSAAKLEGRPSQLARQLVACI